MTLRENMMRIFEHKCSLNGKHQKVFIMVLALTVVVSNIGNSGSKLSNLSILPVSQRGFLENLAPIFTEEGVDTRALKQDENRLTPVKSFFSRGISRFLSTVYDKSELLELPEYTNNFANVWEDLVETDQPIFWVVPGDLGSDTLIQILSQCVNLVLAGILEESQPDEPLKIVPNSEGTALFVNVQTTTVRGLKRAADFNLAGSGLANIILTKHIYEASVLSDGVNSKGRIFTIFSHPVRRIVHNYYSVTNDPENPLYDEEIATMSLVEYSQSDRIVDNVLTRSLVNDFHSPNVTSVQIELAKDIIRRKFLVGILEWLESSVVRIEKHFGWFEQALRQPKVSSCHFHQIYKQASHLLLYPTPEWNTYISDILEERNSADLEIYQYAREIFVKQRSLS